MDYYLHALFENNGYQTLPDCIEVVGQEGTGKSTALVQLAWECEGVGFGQGRPITTMFLSFTHHDPEPLTSLAEFHLQERTYHIATTKPPTNECTLST